MQKEVRQYQAFFNGKTYDFEAESSYQAQQKAEEYFRPSKKNKNLIAVVLSDVPVNTASIGG